MRTPVFAAVGLSLLVAACGQGKPESSQGGLGFESKESPAYKMQEAVYLRDEATIRALAAADPKLIDAPNKVGMTPLAVTVTHTMRERYFATTKLLLELGADPNQAEAEQKLTPLHLAAGAFSKKTEWVALLLEYGADPEATDIHGHTPLYYALRSKQRENAQLLLARMRPTIFTVTAAGDLKQLRRLLRAEGATSKTDEAGLTALHWAAVAGQHEAAKLLLESGADPWARTKDGKLADVMAAVLGYSDVSRTLRPPLR
jgi:palmitoyltransferase ZDHHC13/17